MDPDDAPQPARQGARHLVDADLEGRADPFERTRSDHKSRCFALKAGASPLGAGPGRTGYAIERYIERTVLQRVVPAAPSCHGIVGREHTTHERDKRQPVASVVAQRVDVPPRVAAGRD